MWPPGLTAVGKMAVGEMAWYPHKTSVSCRFFSEDTSYFFKYFSPMLANHNIVSIAPWIQYNGHIVARGFERMDTVLITLGSNASTACIRPMLMIVMILQSLRTWIDKLKVQSKQNLSNLSCNSTLIFIKTQDNLFVKCRISEHVSCT
jgi:hypothetical protein